MKLLNGLELQGFIKERQAKQVRNLRQEHAIAPTLLIVKSDTATDVINAYVRMKTRYAADILIDVKTVSVKQADMLEIIRQGNDNPAIHGIIVPLPIDDVSQTAAICDAIAPQKDVDGLGKGAEFPSATAEAIDWLLAGYNINLEDQKIAILGNGRLVGAPLAHMWKQRGYDVTVLDKSSPDPDTVIQASQVIVSATGSPGVLDDTNIPHGAVVVDAGTASENGVIVGDVAPTVYETRGDVTITPTKGGVGPLTYTLLFDHVIQAAYRMAHKSADAT